MAGPYTQVKYLVIFNEQSGQTFYNHKKHIINYFKKKDIGIVIHNTTPDGSFTHINPNNYERILVAGGDGTLKEVANWIIKSDAETPLAIIPRGSGNIVAQSLGIPLNTNRALKLAIEGKSQKIDAGLVNKREYFLLAAGIGFDAKIIKNTSRKLKKVLGVIAYFLGLAKSFLNMDSDKVFVKSEEMTKTVKAQSIFISNISHFFNFSLFPGAKMNDGYLNVSIFKSVSVMDIFRIIFKIVTGDYSKDWRYSYFKTKGIYILPYKKTIPMQIDGEVVDLTYLDIEVVPHAINIITNKEL